MPESPPSPAIRFLLGGAGGRLLAGLLELKVFPVGIALFAGLAIFMSGHATLVLALFPLGGSLLTTSLLLLGFIDSPDRAAQQ